MDLKAIISSICPVPHFFEESNSQINNGIVLNIPNFCSSDCKFMCHKNRKLFINNEFTSCVHRFTLIKLKMELGLEFYLFGFILYGQLKLPRKKKKKLSDITIEKESIINWTTQLNKFITDQNNFIEFSIKESLNPLHDIKTAISLIFRNTEELIMIESGVNIDEKIENSDPRKKALYKSVSLLEERIKLMDLISNPEAALHGQKRPTPVYKILEKLVKINYALARDRKINLKITGKSFNKPYLYDSFSTVLLVLIDNAIKYSRVNQDVTITISDTKNNGVSVLIESYSPCIKHEMKEKIFDKNIRGGYARYISRKGSGIGLYLAQIVAKANGFKIHHRDSNQKHNIDGIEYTTNIFSFTAKDNV